MLSSQICELYGFHAQPSVIQHADDSFVCFSTQRFYEGEMTRYYYGSSAYTNVVTLFNQSEAYGKRVVAMTAHYFKKYAIQLDAEDESFLGSHKSCGLSKKYFALCD